MTILSGTSGYSFKEWRGAFYPEKLPERRFLEHYSSKLPTVELNNTFYRTPTPEAVQGWCSQVPENFCFSVKAPRRITHLSRLKDSHALLESFAEVVSGFGSRLGVVLFQFPPQFSVNLDRLSVLDAAWPKSICTALEFRHPSWDEPQVRQRIREAGMAWVLVDDETTAPLGGSQVAASAARDFVYLRLRREQYSEQDIARWKDVLDAAAVQRSFVFFKHEVCGPSYAGALNGDWRG